MSSPGSWARRRRANARRCFRFDGVPVVTMSILLRCVGPGTARQSAQIRASHRFFVAADEFGDLERGHQAIGQRNSPRTYSGGGRTLASAKRRRFSDVLTSGFDGGFALSSGNSGPGRARAFAHYGSVASTPRTRWLTARRNRGPWRATLTAALCWALPGAYFDSLGLPCLEPR